MIETTDEDERAMFPGQSTTSLESHHKQVKAPSTQKHYLGHRDRLRSRFRTGGREAIADYELLELLLFRTVPRADTKPLAKALLGRFESIAGVLGAPLERLLEIKGVGPSVALDLKIIAAAGQQMAKGAIDTRAVLSSWSKLIEYCQTAMAHETKEQLRILFLDKKNRLIADEVQQTGTVDHTPVYPREVLKRALEHSATAIILVHNHPSGDPSPSNADITMTRTIIEAAEPLGIVVHDHIIVGRDGFTSLKAQQYI